MNKTRWKVIATLATTMILAAACGSDDGGTDAASETGSPGSPASTASSGATGEPLRVGALFDLSGPAAAFGERGRKAMELAVERVNQSGGVDGRPIEIDFHDGESSPERVVEIVRQMVRDDIQVIIGPAPTAQCEAAREITEPADVLMWCLSPVPEPSPLVFLALEPFDVTLGGIPGLFFAEQGWERVACLHTADASGEAHLQSLQQWGERLDFDVRSESFNTGDADVSVQLAKLRDSDPDVIYSCGSAAAAHVTVLQGMEQLGMEQPVFISANSVSHTVAELVAPSIPEGGVYAEGSSVILGEDLPADFAERDRAIDFVEAYENKYPDDQPETYGGYLQDVMGILSQTMANEPDADGTTIAENLESVCGYQGVLAEYCFGADDHMGYQQDRPVIVEWTANGEFELATILDRTALNE